MKLVNFFETQVKALDALEKRMTAKPSRDVAEQLGKATIGAQVGRIEQRIARLEGQKAVMLGRIEAALDVEHAALAAAKHQAAALPSEKLGTEPAPKRPAPAKPKPRAKAAKGAGATRAKPAKP